MAGSSTQRRTVSAPARTRSALRQRYAFDDENRLVLSDPQDQLHPAQVVQGSLRADAQNRLEYQVARSNRPRDAGPRSFRFDGVWTMRDDSALALTMHGAQHEAKQTLYVKGSLLRAAGDALVFALRGGDDGSGERAQELTLRGRWAADAKNRLTFLVAKADGAEDRLTLQGGWEVGPHHEVLYRYQQRAATPGARTMHTLVFEGAWEIAPANRLAYRLAGSSDSAFEFRASLQSPSLLAREGSLVYQIGVGLSGGREKRQRVALFGAWKLNRDLSVSFEIPYGDGRIQAMRFEGSYALTARDRVAVLLQNSAREPLGIAVTFTRQLVPNIRLFVRLQKAAQESAVLGGVQIRF